MESFVDGVTLLGVPAMLLVPLIVEGLKKAGLPATYAIFAALGAAFGVAVLAELVAVWPVTEPFVRVIVTTILIGFAAAGVYSQGQYWSARK